MLNLVKINPNKTQTLSIEDNKIENILFIEEMLEKNKVYRNKFKNANNNSNKKRRDYIWHCK